jgi:hypothetical protein
MQKRALIKKVNQSFDNFDDGLLLMVKLWDMTPTVKDEVLPFLVDLLDRKTLDDEIRAEIETKILNSSLNLKDKSISVPVIVKKDDLEDGVYCLYTINKNLRGSFSSVIEIRTMSPWEFVDLESKIPLWFVKAIPGLLEPLNLKKEDIHFFKNIDFELEKNRSEIEIEYPFVKI